MNSCATLSLKSVKGEQSPATPYLAIVFTRLAFTKMVRPATRPANTGCLPDPHGDGGPPPEAAYGYVRQYVRIYERTAEHKRNRTQQAPHDEHGLRSIGDTVPNKHPTRDFLRPDYYSSVL